MDNHPYFYLRSNNMNKITKKRVGSNFRFKQIMIKRHQMFEYYNISLGSYNFERHYNAFRKDDKIRNYMWNRGELHRI